MSGFQDALSVSSSGLHAQTMRLRNLSENIANADTPGYHRKIPVFQASRAMRNEVTPVEMGRLELDRTELEQVFDPSHPMADASGYYSGSNVDLLIELADAREAQRSYQANLKMFEQAREMSSSLMDVLRKR